MHGNLTWFGSLACSHRIRGAFILIFLCGLLGCTSHATFNTPDAAIDSLIAAMKADDLEQMKKVLGPESEDVLNSGDPTADKSSRSMFLAAYLEKHQLLPGKDGAMTLVVGKNDWPLPIPLIEADGKWRFDSAAGKEEILNRRIGRNELSTIQTCLAILDAQREYVSKDRDANKLCEYASRFVSENGKKNGLFWPTTEQEPPSPLGALAAKAADEGYSPYGAATSTPRPFHGYLFRILTKQGPNAPGGALDYKVKGKLVGGFAIIAWPVDYGNSGIMTFIMNHDGIVYQRDLGEKTSDLAKAIEGYDPSPEWKKADEAK